MAWCPAASLCAHRGFGHRGTECGNVPVKVYDARLPEKSWSVHFTCGMSVTRAGLTVDLTFLDPAVSCAPRRQGPQPLQLGLRAFPPQACALPCASSGPSLPSQAATVPTPSSSGSLLSSWQGPCLDPLPEPNTWICGVLRSSPLFL